MKMLKAVDRTIAPPLKRISSIRFPQAETRNLSNGLKIYEVNMGNDPVCRIDLVFNAGKYFESKKLLAEFAAGLIKSGTNQKNNLAVTGALDNLGTSIKASATNDHFIITLYSLNKNLAQSLALLLEIINESNYPQSEIDSFRRRSRQRLLVEIEKPSFLASKKLAEQAFGSNHPYGYFPLSENFDAIEQEDLINFNKQLLVANNCSAIVGGYIGETEKNLINKYLGDLQNSGLVLPLSQHDFEERQIENLFIEKEDAAQCAIRIAKRSFNKTDNRAQPFLVLNTIFGGYFGSRLMSNIREDKGYTYGIYSMNRSQLKSGLFLISSEIGGSFYWDAIKEIWKEIDRIKNERISESELELVRNYLSGVFLGGIDGVMNVLDSVRGLVMYDLPLNRMEESFEIVNSVSAEALQDLAIEFFDEKQFFELTVGKRID